MPFDASLVTARAAFTENEMFHQNCLRPVLREAPHRGAHLWLRASGTLLTVMLLADPGHADETALRAASERAAAAMAAVSVDSPPDAGSPSTAEYQLDRGDKLRVRFLDRYDRDDLNGDYVIGESGKLRLARLGLFDVRNKTTSDLEKAVARSAEIRSEKLGYFSIDLVEGRPIYVSGLANRPGAYPFVSGLTVIHAVALAGGIYRSPLLSPGEGLRERSKVSETLEQLKGPIAKKARLEAELSGHDTIGVPADLAELDPAGAQRFIEREQLSLQRNREQDARESESLRSMVQFSQSEVDSYDAEIASMTQRIAEQSQLFERLKTLYQQKIVNAGQFNQSLVALDSVQRDKQLAIAGLARAKASLEKAKKELAMITLAARSRVAKELAEAEAEISRLKSSAEDRRRLAGRLDSIAGRTVDETGVSYRILRRTPSGAIASFAAAETSLLAPGDVLQLEAPRSGPRISSQ